MADHIDEEVRADERRLVVEMLQDMERDHDELAARTRDRVDYQMASEFASAMRIVIARIARGDHAKGGG